MSQDIKAPMRFPAFGHQIRNMSFGKHYHALVTDDGSVFVWGYSLSWELGIGVEQAAVGEPTKIAIPSPVKQVVCGENHGVALTESGEIWTWGWGGFVLQVGSLGHGQIKDSPLPKQIVPFSEAPIVQIAAGDHHTLALDADGKVYAWGRGQNGVTGLMSKPIEGFSSSYLAPQLIEFFQQNKIKISFISAGSNHSGAISDKGVLYTWGKNDAGQTGGSSVSLDMYACDPIPIQPNNLTGETIRHFAAGVAGSICVNDNHEVKDWGDKRYNQPELVRGDNDSFLSVNIVQVAAGNKFFAAVDDEGRLFTWGLASSGCLVHTLPKRGLFTSTPFFARFNPSPTMVEGFGPEGRNGRVVRVFAAHHNIAVITTRS